jgi:two-component sensor histidine kinase
VGLAGICHDITALKQAESARLEDARRQGDALVREVHHRSKNRLQGLLGLLQLQYDESPSPPLARAMSQIRAVAVVHDLERRSAERGVGAGDLLDELTRSAAQAHGRTCALEAPPPAGLRIAPDYAVALSLALSELLTNACKHAPEGAGVRVAAEPGEADGELGITVTNPLPEGPPPPALGTGLASLEAILPPRGAALSIVRRAGRFEAALRLTAPALEAGAPPSAGPGGASGGRAPSGG